MSNYTLLNIFKLFDSACFLVKMHICIFVINKDFVRL